MSSFDTKISEGNSGLLRSRLDFVSNFLLFQGISGHFTTIVLNFSDDGSYYTCARLDPYLVIKYKAIGATTSKP